MKKWSSIITVALFAATICSSCGNKLDEEPPVNAGYKNDVRLPDPEALSMDDVLLIQEQQKEFNENN